MFFAIGLLAPQPRLIARLLWHQRKLPYWCTLVWNSHQLIPNKAYSPQGRLLRKRRDSVFRCGYDCTPLHPGPQFWGGTRISRYKPSSYCWLSSTNDFSHSWRPQAGLGSRHDGIRSSPRCKTFQGSKLRFSRNRNHQGYSPEGTSVIGCLQGRLFFPARDEN